MKKSALFVASSFLIASSSFAYSPSQDVPFQRAMNKTLAGVIDNKAVAMGSTPLQRASTMSAISSYLSQNATKVATGVATAGGVAIAAVTAPSWLLTLAAGTAISFGLSLGLNYFFNPATQKIESASSLYGNAPSGVQYIQAGPGYVFTDLTTAQRYMQGSRCSNMASYLQQGFEFSSTPIMGRMKPSDTFDSTIGMSYGIGQCYWAISFLPSDSPAEYGSCSASSVYSRNTRGCVPMPYLAPVPSTQQTKTVSESHDTWISAPSGTPIDQPVPSSTLAPLIDKAWKEAAAQPGYQGVPYSYSNPVTSADVDTFLQQNPSIYPKVGDIVSPQVLPSGSTSGGTSSSTSTSNNPFAVSSPSQSSPGTDSIPTTTPGTTTNVTNVSVDLGPNPNIGEPSLQDPPTGQQILQPLLDIVNPFKTLSFTRNATCPTYSIDLFGKTHVMDMHCILFEEHKNAIRGVMIAIFTIWSVMIILGA